MRFEGRTAIVTGAASGIGRATALLLAREGACVLAADVQDAANEETVAMIQAAGGKSAACRADVSRESETAAMVEAALSIFGRVDILHQNAYWNRPGSVTELAEDGWDGSLNVTLKALYLGAKHGIPAMLRTGGGAIIHTASVHSLVSFRNCAAYDTAKAGVMGLTRSIALDYGPQIRCNAVLPGAIYPTGAWKESQEEIRQQFARAVPMQRLGAPEDIARAVAFLASDDASFITGTGLVVDGGFTILGPVDR